jgi:hypothetical protein
MQDLDSLYYYVKPWIMAALLGRPGLGHAEIEASRRIAKLEERLGAP